MAYRYGPIARMRLLNLTHSSTSWKAPFGTATCWPSWQLVQQESSGEVEALSEQELSERMILYRIRNLPEWWELCLSRNLWKRRLLKRTIFRFGVKICRNIRTTTRTISTTTRVSNHQHDHADHQHSLFFNVSSLPSHFSNGLIRRT